MNLIQRYLNKQLTRVLDGLAESSTRHLVRVAHETDAEVGASELVPPRGQLLPARQLRP